MSKMWACNPGLRFAGVLALGLASCGASGSKAQTASSYAAAPDPSAAPPKDADAPWTKDFDSPAMLLADEIRVEGPRGLLAHIAVRVDPASHDELQKTIPAGFLQQVTVKPNTTDSEIHAQLDNLTLVATRRLSVLERPGPVDLVVDARGQTVWHDLQTKQEKRAETIRLTGKIAR
jgi:hypothetical protein